MSPCAQPHGKTRGIRALPLAEAVALYDARDIALVPRHEAFPAPARAALPGARYHGIA